MNFADRLIEAVRLKGNPCVVGLDPRIDQMPGFIQESLTRTPGTKAVRESITHFHSIILQKVASLVPAVKPQAAFYEQYGLGGLMALQDDIRMAKRLGLVVIVDAKRGDVPSTAQAYANAFLGRTQLPNEEISVFDADAVTVSPFLGRDSLEPFVQVCEKFAKGIFVLVKTSNAGSRDVQDLSDRAGKPVYLTLARIVRALSRRAVGKSGYSSIGAVVGATFPAQAGKLRSMMPNSILLVPGYGSQGGTAKDVASCFNKDGLGAVISASRSLTYAFKNRQISEEKYQRTVQDRVVEMVKQVNSVSPGVGEC